MRNALSESDYPGELPRFEQRNVTERGTWEPTLAITRTGAVFYTSSEWDALDGAIQTPVKGTVFRSTDGGLTWQEKHPNVQGMDAAPWTPDPYLHADPVTGRIFFSYLYLACDAVYWSDDDGETWSVSPQACGRPGPRDHQTVFTSGPSTLPTVGYPNVVYACGNHPYGPGMVRCSSSLDGGRTWLEGDATNKFMDGDYRTTPTACANAAHGHGTGSYGSDGVAYLAHGIGARHDDCPTAQHVVYVSHDSGITWEMRTVDDTTGVSPHFQDEHEGNVAVDEAGTVYYFWIGADSMPYLSVSQDEGATWSTPVPVAAPGVTSTRSPALVAGSEGRIVVLYLGTRFPDAATVAEENLTTARWDAYVAVSLNADEGNPIFATALANPPDDPLWIGACTTWYFPPGGGFSAGECPVRDFWDIQIDPRTGQIWAALIDGCIRDECSLKKNDGDSWGVAASAVGVQTGGTRLIGG